MQSVPVGGFGLSAYPQTFRNPINTIVASIHLYNEPAHEIVIQVFSNLFFYCACIVSVQSTTAVSAFLIYCAVA